MKKRTILTVPAVLAVTALLAGPLEARSRDWSSRNPTPATLIAPVVEIDPVEAVPSPGAGPSLPSITGIAEFAPEEARAMAADHAEIEHALRVLVGFLELDAGQVEAFVGLLGERREAVLPALHEIAIREQVLHRLIEAGDNPAAIGQVILEIRDLYKRIAGIQARFLEAFAHLLGPEQLERYAAIRVAAELQPLLPAFKFLSLI